MDTLGDEITMREMQKLELLSKAALRIQQMRTQKEIYTATGEELKRLSMQVLIILFTKKSAGTIVHSTAESLFTVKDNSLSGLTCLLDHHLLTIIKKKKAHYMKPLKNVQILPAHTTDRPVITTASKRGVAAPLVIQDKSIGCLLVISDTIGAHDTAVMYAFANQIAPALENARLRQESQKRTDALTKNVKEQQLLRELNTKLFLAQSRNEVLDAAIEGIHALGKSFSNISILGEEGTHCKIVRVKIDPSLLKTVEKIGRTVLPKFTLLGYNVPVWEKDNIYSTFFEKKLPLISSNIAVHGYAIMKADLSAFYTGLGPKRGVLQHAIKRVSTLLPYKSVMAFPIIVDNHTVGTLSVSGEKVFTQKEFELMKTVGEMVSSAMERVIHAEKLTETINELRAVQEITALMNVGTSLEHILVQLCSCIKEVYGYAFVYPLLFDPSRNYLNLTYLNVPSVIGKKLSRIFGADVKKFKYPIVKESFYYNHVVKEKECIIVEGLEELAEKIPVDIVKTAIKKFSPLITKALFGSSKEENNVMIAPLPYGNEVIGILFLGHKNALTEKDFQRLKYFLNQVGIAIGKSDVELRLRQSLEKLKELDQMKSEFIDIASHELRTPLTTLKLYLEMILLEQYGDLSPSLKKRIKVMEGGVNRLEEIIDQTLVASRLIKNKLVLDKTPVSLMEVATDVIHQFQPLWNVKHQKVFLESPARLPRIIGDKKALFTVIGNLLENAIRYSPEKAEILIRFTERMKEIECAVIDRGCGIPVKYQEKIFEEFYIVPSEIEYARMDGRTGLGLFIVKGIVEHHGGRIWVESTVGQGSTFCFTVPKKG